MHTRSDEGHGAREFSTRRTISQDVADMLAAARRSRGLSFREAARRVGVAPGMIVHLEKARRAPGVATTEALIRVYWLDGGEADMLWEATVTDAGRGSWSTRRET